MFHLVDKILPTAKMVMELVLPYSKNIGNNKEVWGKRWRKEKKGLDFMLEEELWSGGCTNVVVAQLWVGFLKTHLSVQESYSWVAHGSPNWFF